MVQFTNEAIKSVATEAIVSKDGTIQRRISNYETVIDNVSHDNFRAFPALAANDADDIIPVLMDSIYALPPDSENTMHPGFKRHGTYILATIIILAFTWSVYSLFIASKDTNIESDQFVESIPSIEIVNDEERLRQIADQILAGNRWSEEQISMFLHHWNKLDESITHDVTASSWYQLFIFNLKQRVKQEFQLHSTLKKKAEHNPLFTLAIVTGVINKKGELTSFQPGQSKYHELVDELTKEIKQADHSSKRVTSSIESEAELNTRLREKYDVLPPAIPDAIANVEKKSSDVVQESSDHHNSIVISDITRVINQYKTAYEAGDMQAIARIFGASKSNKLAAKQLTTSFSTIFDNSMNRSINFYDIESQISGSSAMITSKFNASMEFKNNKGTQYVVAESKMEIQKTGDQVVISSLNIVNRNVNVVTPTSTQLKEESSESKLSIQEDIPTPAELQDLTTQLVTAYETGDIRLFLSLFSQDIKTNDRIDLNGVKQDYTQLFQTTSDRQMFIQNLKWVDESIGAKGIGDLEVTILTEEGGTVYSMEGKIQIIAQKINGKVLISHLYHIEREK